MLRWRFRNFGSNLGAFEELARLYERLESEELARSCERPESHGIGRLPRKRLDPIDLEISLAEQVDSSMFAVLGAVLARESDVLRPTVLAKDEAIEAIAQSAFPAVVKLPESGGVPREDADDFPVPPPDEATELAGPRPSPEFIEDLLRDVMDARALAREAAAQELIEDYLRAVMGARALTKEAAAQELSEHLLRSVKDAILHAVDEDEAAGPAGPRPDQQVIVMGYRHFRITDKPLFQKYVEKHFGGDFIPRMSPELARQFRQSICEIFQNAVDHSETRLGIFACGYYSPGINRLELCIADRGMGIRENIRKKKGIELDPPDAIEWALAGTHTTRTQAEGRPGGLGLKLIRSFVRLNRGRLQIVSDRGYWCLGPGKPAFTSVLPSPFPGTVVSIEIDTADTHSYRLREEVDRKKIF